MAAWIEEILEAHVRPTGFIERDNIAVGRFWGTRDELNTLLTKAQADRTYLKGWRYRINCADGDADLACTRGRFSVKESQTTSFLHILRPPVTSNVIVL